MVSRRQFFRDILVLLLLSYAAFWWNLGKLGLIDPDEPFYALSSRKMVQTGDWLTPRIFGAPQFEKPVFYYWLVAGAYRAFGENEFSGRLPSALAATLLVLLSYAFGLRLFTARAALIAGIFMASGLEVCLMGRLMLTDVPLALFITGALYCYWRAEDTPGHRDRWIFLHLVCAGFAALTKGPIGNIASLLVILAFCRVAQRPCRLRGRGFWLGLAAYALIVVPWYGLMFELHGWRFWDEFFYRDNWLRLIRAEHPANNHLWYYPAILLFGSIPWLPAVLLALRRFVQKWRETPVMFVTCWLGANLLLLTAAQSKLPSYILYLFVPLALAVGAAAEWLFTGGFQGSRERAIVTGAAAFQAVLVAAAAFTPTLRAFAMPLGLAASLLAAACAALWLGRYRAWITASALSIGLLIICTLTCCFPPLEAMVSTRPVAREMAAEALPSEPLLAGKFAVRGIAYYTRRPVAVLAGNAHPFWADHPLEIVVGKKGLAAFLKTHPSALCTLRPGDWNGFSRSSAFKLTAPGQWIGENLLIRALPHLSGTAGKAAAK